MRDNLDQRYYQNRRAAQGAEQERQQMQQARQDANWSWREDRSGLRRERQGVQPQLQYQPQSQPQYRSQMPYPGQPGMQQPGMQQSGTQQPRQQSPRPVDIPIPHSKKVDIPIAYTTPGQQAAGSRTGQNYANRPQGQGSYANRPQQQGSYANRSQQQTSYANRPQGRPAPVHEMPAQNRTSSQSGRSVGRASQSGHGDYNRRTREARMRRNEQLRRRRNFFRALPLILVLAVFAGFGIYKLVKIGQEHAAIREEQMRADEEARRHEQEELARQEAEEAARLAEEEEKAAALAALKERSPEVASFAEGYTVTDQSPAYIGLDQDGQSTYGVLIDVDAGKSSRQRTTTSGSIPLP